MHFWLPKDAVKEHFDGGFAKNGFLERRSSMSDLIAAVATPPGTGGVGILRLSGPGAAQAAARVFRPKGTRALPDAPDRQLLYGTLLDQAGQALDTGLAFVSRAPHSYTGEETAELQCHGSPMVLSLVLDALFAAGARQARAGEFTQRAFLNGKLDLTQAEAVIDLIEAETPAAARQAAAPDALWDVAYYNGRYYVYFGIVPCLLFQLPFEALTGIRDLPPALPMILLAWLYILAVFGFVKQAVRRWFPQASAAAYLLTAAGAASGTQIYYLLHRPSVYEYAILCGATFVLWALWQWLCAANTPVNRRKALAFHLAFGSLCMAFVAGCRPQMVLFAALALPILWPRYITEKRLCTRRGAGEAAAFILPVVLVAVGLMWYNAARFGSPFDFGANYNLTSNDMTRRGFAVGRIAPAAVTFLAGIPGVQTVFPYLTATRMQTNYMGLTITELYYGGAFACLPLLWGLAALPLARRRLGSRRDLRAVIRLVLVCTAALAELKFTYWFGYKNG